MKRAAVCMIYINFLALMAQHNSLQDVIWFILYFKGVAN